MPKNDVLRAITLEARSLARRRGISFAQAHAELLTANPEVYEAYLRERADGGVAGSRRAAHYAAKVRGLTEWGAPRNAPSVSGHSLFLRNVPYQSSAEELRDFLEKVIGGVRSVRLLGSHADGVSHGGVGFVEFSDADYLEAALRKPPPHAAWPRDEAGAGAVEADAAAAAAQWLTRLETFLIQAGRLSRHREYF